MLLPIPETESAGGRALITAASWRHALFDPLQMRNLPLRV